MLQSVLDRFNPEHRFSRNLPGQNTQSDRDKVLVELPTVYQVQEHLFAFKSSTS